MTEARHSSPQALRQAVTDRLREYSVERGGTQLGDLLRQFAYDRLLARVFTNDPERWVLKGAVAMLARLPTAARHSKDIDLYRREGDLAAAESALRVAAAIDLGDYFRFELGLSRPSTQGARALRLPVVAYLGQAEFASFHVDLVASLTMSGEADEVPPLIDMDLGLQQPRYRVYPVADHIADKVCAMLETHPREHGDAVSSTRYRDLVDLVTFARSSQIDGSALTSALREEAARRDLALPQQLLDPPGRDWRAGYARAVRDAPSLPDRDLDSALEVVRQLIDPVLDGEAVTRWEPTNLGWE